MVFYYNLVYYKSDGGAICLRNGVIEIDSKASLRFSHNSADLNGGAIRLDYGELIIKPNANLNFSNNSAVLGGAIF